MMGGGPERIRGQTHFVGSGRKSWPVPDVSPGNRYNASHMQCGPPMKTTTIPPLRVSQELRKRAEAVLEQGETLSGFVLDALTRSIEYRNARREFIARGLAGAAQAKKTGKYVPADRVIKKLARKLVKAKQRAA